MSLLRKTTKRLQSQPRSNSGGLEEGEYEVDDELTWGRNRVAERFGKLVEDNDELSDRVKFRLWLARQIALAKYRETRA